ncbi:MAG: fibronectin type III domain-containing protein [Wenzhouxiangellaceae bacterium]
MTSHIRTVLFLSSLLGALLLAGCDGKSLEAPYDERASAPGSDESASGPGSDESASAPGSDESASAPGSNARASRPGSALLSWHPPTERADGSPLRDLAGYRVYFGKGARPARYVLEITNPAQTSQLIGNLDRGRWHFSITAYDRQGLESARSAPASKIIG